MLTTNLYFFYIFLGEFLKFIAHIFFVFFNLEFRKIPIFFNFVVHQVSDSAAVFIDFNSLSGTSFSTIPNQGIRFSNSFLYLGWLIA